MQATVGLPLRPSSLPGGGSEEARCRTRLVQLLLESNPGSDVGSHLARMLELLESFLEAEGVSIVLLCLRIAGMLHSAARTEEAVGMARQVVGKVMGKAGKGALMTCVTQRHAAELLSAFD